MDLSFSDLNYNSVVIDTVSMLESIEMLPGFEARAALSRFPPASDARFATTASCASMTAKYSFETSTKMNNFAPKSK